MDRLFVYGIFLSQRNRDSYGMANPEYATVPGYATFGDYIVQAIPIQGVQGLQLTGLTVDIDPDYWGRLDRLEGGYDRTLVTTSNGEKVHMYVGKGN